MRKMVLFAALMALTTGLAETSTPKGFTDNMDEALTEAEKSGKLVYVCFSGSDWCGWCKRLEKEVLSKKSFREGVTNDYVIVYIDSPSNKELLSDRAKVENPKLVEQYDIHGFPTALIINAKGEVVANTGYRAGGAKKYVKHLKALKKHGPEIRALQSQIEELAKKLRALEEAD